MSDTRGLPWWFRLDEWLHQHIDKHLGRRVVLWRAVYTGPRRWFCEWADQRLQRDLLNRVAELARTMCLQPPTSTSASGNSVAFECRCPRHTSRLSETEK